jgi:hypothetical protein
VGREQSAHEVLKLNVVILGCSLRVNHKQISTGSSPNRKLQFEYLTELRGRFQRRHLPIISVDTKKRELVGNFKS